VLEIALEPPELGTARLLEGARILVKIAAPRDLPRGPYSLSVSFAGGHHVRVPIYFTAVGDK